MTRLFPWSAAGRRFPGLVAVAAIAAVLTAAGPVAAADGGSGGTLSPLFGLKYWDNFVDFWAGAFRKQNGIVLLILGVGAVSLFIITRSKALK